MLTPFCHPDWGDRQLRSAVRFCYYLILPIRLGLARGALGSALNPVAMLKASDAKTPSNDGSGGRILKNVVRIRSGKISYLARAAPSIARAQGNEIS